jgi:uncharacterized protein DUF262
MSFLQKMLGNKGPGEAVQEASEPPPYECDDEKEKPPRMRKRMADVPIRHISRDFRDGAINVNPSFQRRFVWREAEKRLLIESLYEDAFIHAIVVSERPSGQWVVLDGKQRILTMIDFVENRFPDLRGFYFSHDDKGRGRTLTHEEQAAFENTQLSVAIYSDLTSEQELRVFQNLQRGKPLTTGEKLKATNAKLTAETDALQKRYPGVVVTRGVKDRSNEYATAIRMTAAIVSDGSFFFSDKPLSGFLSGPGDEINARQVAALDAVYKRLNGISGSHADMYGKLRMAEIMVLGYFLSRPFLAKWRDPDVVRVLSGVHVAYADTKWAARGASSGAARFLRKEWLEELGLTDESQLGTFQK